MEKKYEGEIMIRFLICFCFFCGVLSAREVESNEFVSYGIIFHEFMLSRCYTVEQLLMTTNSTALSMSGGNVVKLFDLSEAERKKFKEMMSAYTSLGKQYIEAAKGHDKEEMHHILKGWVRKGKEMGKFLYENGYPDVSAQWEIVTHKLADQFKGYCEDNYVLGLNAYKDTLVELKELNYLLFG